MAGKYELKKSSDEQFMFNLRAVNGEIILTSERYTAKASAKTGIASCQENSPDDTNYDRLTSSSNQRYFVLKAANGEVIGRSEMYSSGAAMETGIASVRTIGPTTSIDDRA